MVEFTAVRIVATNISNNPRGINTINGVVVVGRGDATPEIEVSPGELQSMRDSGTFTIVENGEGTQVSIDPPEARASRMTKRMDDLEARLDKLEGRTATVRTEERKVDVPPPGPSKDEIEAVIAMNDNKNITFSEFKSAAIKVLGDSTPAKRDDIVSALKARLQTA